LGAILLTFSSNCSVRIHTVLFAFTVLLRSVDFDFDLAFAFDHSFNVAFDS
jgi:hypothetical protein